MNIATTSIIINNYVYNSCLAFIINTYIISDLAIILILVAVIINILYNGKFINIFITISIWRRLRLTLTTTTTTTTTNKKKKKKRQKNQVNFYYVLSLQILLRKFTLNKPKVLLIVQGKPELQYLVETDYLFLAHLISSLFFRYLGRHSFDHFIFHIPCP